MSKRILSILLAVVLVLSLAVVATVSASAAVDSEGRYTPSATVKTTQRLYFQLPSSWCSEKFNIHEAGAYWWGGQDSCGSVDGASVGAAWPGYKMQIADRDLNLFYVDFPMDDPDNLTPIVFNNFFDGGDAVKNEDGTITYKKTKEEYVAAKQTINQTATYYGEGDSEFYDNLLDGDFFWNAEEAYDEGNDEFFGDFKDNFFTNKFGIQMTLNNMIYIVDTDESHIQINEFNGKETYVGEWYFYYGDGSYGALPNKSQAEELGMVWKLDSDERPTVPTADDPKPTVPGPAQDPTSGSSPVATDDTPTVDNNAIATGALPMVIVVLTFLAVAVGAVVVTRKKYE